MIRVAVIGIVGNSVFLPVPRFHEGGETVVAADFHSEWGGKGFNQALSAARQGAHVSFLAAVNGRDVASITEFSRGEGIDCTFVTREEGSPFAVIMTDARGANRVTVYHGAQLCASDVDGFAEEIARADVLLLTNEVAEAVNVRAVEIARERGTRVILNPAPSRALPELLLENVAYFTPNEHETEGLEGRRGVITTLGARGCLIGDTGEIIPAVDAGAVVDTTGAGDTFNGALAVALAEGRSIGEACRMANAASSLKVTRRFVAGAVPTREETEKILEVQNG